MEAAFGFRFVFWFGGFSAMYPTPQKLRPFLASRLKIGRAARHVATLRGEVAAYMARVPIYTDMWIDENDPKYMAFSLNIAEPIPMEWAPIIGDAVHNLRASLDLLACEAVRLNGDSDASTYFPFAESAGELETMIKRRMSGASDAAKDLVRSFQPYIGGNAALRGVHDLDIYDKHRALLPTAAQLNFPGGGVGLEEMIGRTGQPMMGTRLIESMPFGELKPGRSPVRFALVFPRGGPFTGLEMVPTFEDLIQDFTRVVDAFESLYLGAVLEQDAPT